MKKLILTLLMVVWITISSFSQNTYPRKILIGNDTVVAVTKGQLIRINRSLNDYIHLREINKNLQMDIAVSDSLVYYWKNIALKSDSIIALENKKFNVVNLENHNIKNTLRREYNKSVITVGGLCLFIGFLLGVFIFQFNID